jgi:hypothetical protein
MGETLAYATPETEQRVMHRPGRRVELANKATSEVLGELLIYIFFAVLFLAWTRPLYLLIVIPGAVALYAAVFAMFWLFSTRLDRPAVIEVTPTELVVSNFDERAKGKRVPLEGLYAIRYVGHARSIFFYRRGKEMGAIPIQRETEWGEQIAGFLRDVTRLSAAKEETEA